MMVTRDDSLTCSNCAAAEARAVQAEQEREFQRERADDRVAAYERQGAEMEAAQCEIIDLRAIVATQAPFAELIAIKAALKDLLDAAYDAAPLHMEGAIQDAERALSAIPGSPTLSAPSAAFVPLPDAATTRAKIADGIVQEVAELPDRDSPEGWPEAMLVTEEELRLIVLEHLDAATPAPRWQPIKTAPKGQDRHAVLVWCADNQCTYTAWWNGESWDYFAGGGSARVIEHEITHWMPLPERPTVDAAESCLPPLTDREDRLREERDAAVQALTGLRRQLLALATTPSPQPPTRPPHAPR